MKKSRTCILVTKWGKPGIDPVSLFKIVLIQHLYGIRSMRQPVPSAKAA